MACTVSTYKKTIDGKGTALLSPFFYKKRAVEQHMISNPKYGWCTFQIKDFKGSPSYMTSVPIDLLEAFISYRKNGCGSAYFDEEGSDFILVLLPYEVYIIENKEESVLHCFEDININQLEAELISDLESDLHNWAVEFTVDDITVSESKEMIQNKINELKALHK